MEELGYTLFDTDLGPIAIAWSSRGISALELAAEKTEDTVYRLRANRPNTYPAAPPARVQEVITRIQKHLRGETQDFSNIPLDLHPQSTFYQAVYEITRAIPAGKTRTYGDIATQLGKPNAARAVGQALAKNPILLLMPCHRVLGSKGAATGFSAPGGVETKKRLLALEKASVQASVSTAAAPF